MILNEACDVLVQFVFPSRILRDYAIAVLHGKNCLNMNLGIGICHNDLYFVPNGQCH